MSNVTFMASARPDEAAQKRRSRTQFRTAVIGYAIVIVLSCFHPKLLALFVAPSVFLYQSWASLHADMETKTLRAMASWDGEALHVWLPGSIKFAGTYANQHIVIKRGDLSGAQLTDDGKLFIEAAKADVATAVQGKEGKATKISGIEVNVDVDEGDRERVAEFLAGIEAAGENEGSK